MFERLFAKLGGKKETAEVKVPEIDVESLKKIAASISDEDKAKIVALAEEGRKIEAVKAFTDAAGVGLKDAKDIIDNYKTYLG